MGDEFIEDDEVIEKLDPSDKPDKAPSKNEAPNRESDAIYRDYRNINIYRFLKDAYTSQGGFSGKTTADSISYLHRNSTENFYLTRVRNSTNINYFKKYILAPIKSVFSNSINFIVTNRNSDTKKEIENSTYKTFLNNITGGGVSFDEYLKRQKLPSAYRDSVCFTVMDKKANGITPFIYRKEAYEVPSNLYGTDSLGNLTWIIFDEDVKINSDDTKTYFRRYWGLDFFALYSSDDYNKDMKDWALVDEMVPNDLGVLPVYAMRPHEYDTGDYLPFPESFNIAALNCDLYNKWSNVSWILLKQAYSRMVTNGDGEDIAEGVTNAMNVPITDVKTWQPFLLEPNPDIIEVHTKVITDLKTEMFDLMEENGTSVDSLKKQESGVAKSYTFKSTDIASKNCVNLSTDFVIWLDATFRIYQGEENSDWEAEITFPNNFTPTVSLSITELLELADHFTLAGMKANAADIYKLILLITRPNSTEQEVDELKEEINGIVTKGNE